MTVYPLMTEAAMRRALKISAAHRTPERAAAAAALAQREAHDQLDGSFELVERDGRPARLIRRPRLRRDAEVPHLVAGHPVCTFAEDCPPEFVQELLDILNDKVAWGEL